MASVREAAAIPKVRARRDGAAVPLDELDKRLLNLMQGSFPLAPRPYAHVAELAELSEGEVLGRVQRLLDERIVRQVTPIFDTRVLGYSSMLVAARVDPENPHRAAKVVNSHPGVSHNYLRNHDFNMWFTIATEPGSKLGLAGTLEVLRELTGAESVRQLPTLKLFKIRMDLEMEKGTADLAAAGVAEDPIEPDPIEPTELDVAVIRALQGDMPVVPEPYAPAAARLGISQGELLEALESMRERRALRRVAAILFHRRAGFSANGMGVWNVPDDRIVELGPRMASYRGISHCYQRPTYADWRYSVFTMAHGRSKEECDAILDTIAAETGIEDRRTLYSSTEFKKIRLLYFTDDHRRWEAEHT
jgi:DNA-binding Lrp family transcriptional regulator